MLVMNGNGSNTSNCCRHDRRDYRYISGGMVTTNSCREDNAYSEQQYSNEIPDQIQLEAETEPASSMLSRVANPWA
jgi:hypothetical protein